MFVCFEFLACPAIHGMCEKHKEYNVCHGKCEPYIRRRHILCRGNNLSKSKGNCRKQTNDRRMPHWLLFMIIFAGCMKRVGPGIDPLSGFDWFYVVRIWAMPVQAMVGSLSCSSMTTFQGDCVHDARLMSLFCITWHGPSTAMCPLHVLFVVRQHVTLVPGAVASDDDGSVGTLGLP